MGYDIFKFGALYLDDKIQPVPQRPNGNGDIPLHDSKTTISIGPSKKGEGITWIKPSGLNLLVADRVLLVNVSWEDLAKNGLVEGMHILIDDQRFCCRLLQVGEDRDIPNEWDKTLDETGEDNSLWHWKDIYFLGAEVLPISSYRAARGHYSARTWCGSSATNRGVGVGFRPALEPLLSDRPVPNINLDGIDFCLSSIPGGENFYPILQPVKKDVFADIPIGKEVRMYTFMENGRPVHMDEEIKNLAQVTLTDRYFGDEYLIPWIISNGVAVTSQSVKEQV